MRAPQAAFRKPVGIQNRPPNVLYVIEHEMLYILIHAPHTRAVTFWHIGNIPPMIS